MPSGVPGVCLSRVAYTPERRGDHEYLRQRRRPAAVAHGRPERSATASYCLAVASTAKTAAVRLRRCNASSYQQWTALGNGLLRNALSGRCLRDPGSTVTPGTPVNVGSCIPTASRIWWLP